MKNVTLLKASDFWDYVRFLALPLHLQFTFRAFFRTQKFVVVSELVFTEKEYFVTYIR
jgi:hypothetical protein